MIVREATPADRDGIEDLRRRCFPDDPIEKRFPTARVFVADDGWRPVAHLAFLEQRFVIDGVEHRAALATDAMTDPGFRRQGLFSRVVAFAQESIRDDYAFSTAWQIRRSVLPAMTTNGWLPVLRAPVFLRPLLWKSRGVPANADEAVAAPRAESNRVHGIVQPWRFSERDASSVAGGGMTGVHYTRTANLVTREAILKGQRTLCLVDVTPHARGEIQAALRATDCRLAAALLSWRHPAMPMLLRLGFFPGPHWFRFLVNVFDGRIDPKRLHWALSWADTDHL